MNLKQQIKLREWQKKAEYNWHSNNFRGIFSVATGGGKTIFAIKMYSPSIFKWLN